MHAILILHHQVHHGIIISDFQACSIGIIKKLYPPSTPIYRSNHTICLSISSSSSLACYPVLPAVDSFPDGKLSVKVLERLLHATKVPLFQSIGTEWQHFAQVLAITFGPITYCHLQGEDPEKRGRHVIKEWLERSHYRLETPTWRSLVVALASLETTEPLATAISHYFGAPSIPSDTKSTRKEQHKQALRVERWEDRHFREMEEEQMFLSHGPFRLPSLAHGRSQSVSLSTPTSLLEKETKESSQSLESECHLYTEERKHL